MLSNPDKILETIASKLTKYTCQLFIDKVGKKEYSQPFGSGTLFTHNKNYYLLSCAHVLADQKPGSTYIFKSKNEISTIGGENLFTRLPKSNNRDDDKYDFAIVKLNKETTKAFINRGHKFLDEADILTGYKPDVKDLAMCIGYPANRTKVNTQLKTVELMGLKYISQFKILDLTKFGCNPNFHLFVKYSINNFINRTDKLKARGPKPAGLSGGGVWAIIKNDKNEIDVRLVGILTEYSEKHSVLISTRIDLLIDSIRQKFDPTLINKGVKISILK
jgi:hypothetical protein